MKYLFLAIGFLIGMVGSLMSKLGWLIDQLSSPSQEELIASIELNLPRFKSPADRVVARKILVRLKNKDLLTTELIEIKHELFQLTKQIHSR